MVKVADNGHKPAHLHPDKTDLFLQTGMPTGPTPIKGRPLLMKMGREPTTDDDNLCFRAPQLLGYSASQPNTGTHRVCSPDGRQAA